jgi:hypothetical protein
LDAGESLDLTLVINSFELPLVKFQGILQFTSTAAQGIDTVDVELDIIGPQGPNGFTLLGPADQDTVRMADSTTVTFQWNQANDPNWGDQVRYQLWLSSGATSANVAETHDTTATVDFANLNLEKLKLVLPSDTLGGTLKWWVLALSDPDSTLSDTVRSLYYIPVPPPPEPLGIGDKGIPVVFELASIYPSPFNGTTTIKYGADRAEHVRLTAYDISGREVAALVNERKTVGWYNVTWNASALSSGVYILRLESGGRVKTAKVALIK